MSNVENSCNFPEDAEILQGFISDSQELLDEIEPDLIELQKVSEPHDPSNLEILNRVFRLFHSLKGAASYFHLENIISVTHEAETVLNYIKGGKLKSSPQIIDLLIRACDFIRKVLEQLSENGSEASFASEAKSLAEQLSMIVSDKHSCNEKSNDDNQDHTSAYSTAVEKKLESKMHTQNSQDIQITIDEDTKAEFIKESKEAFERIELCLMGLEKGDNSEEALSSAFRDIHSFKGNCGILGLSDMEQLSHKMETVLDYMKTGEVDTSPENISVLLKIVDVLRDTLNNFSNGDSGTIEGCHIMMDLLDDMIPITSDEDVPKLGEILVSRGDISEEDLNEALATKNKPLGEVLTDSGATSKRAVESALAKQENLRSKLNVQKDIRVSLEKLDALNDLVGELVIAQLMVTRNPDLRGREFENFEKAAHHLDRVTSELQDIAMSLRMIPVSVVFKKMIRLVHDLSRKFDKKVELKMIGEDTEVDKTVVELISDPLVHIIRNAIDHGIESPDERIEKGKAETGHVTLEARHEGGEVWILIKDDGRGLDREKILEKAFAAGLVDNMDTSLPDAQIFSFIFEPGFSTADKVTDVSGRGVGLDVVKNNLEKLKGKIEIISNKDQGTTFILRIPLTLAIIEGMLIRVGSNYYIIPLLAIKESLVTDNAHITVTPDGQEYVNVRGKLLPVIRLHDFFNVSPDNTLLDRGILLNVQNENKEVLLFIDEILEQQQTVVKGLPNYIGNLPGVSGCTILGNGDVGLILDIGTIVTSLADSGKNTRNPPMFPQRNSSCAATN
ncbi:MAG TPA: chemotaxis protein CheA [Deltaproteobacteria bacterium]|nr:chemotaxis protein CheA [Deltaproteobacteria bacterium]